MIQILSLNLINSIKASKNLDFNNIVEANKRKDDSCSESDLQYSSTQNLDLNNIIQKRITKENQKENTNSYSQYDKQHSSK